MHSLIGAKSKSAPKYSWELCASTEPRFNFDTFCNVQLLLVREPVASGTVIWLGAYDQGGNDVSPRAASGALIFDVGLLFSGFGGPLQSTPLGPPSHVAASDIEQRFRNWLHFNEATGVTSKAMPTRVAPELAFEAPASIDVSRPYSEILADLIETGPWRSQTKLAKILGTSHTQVGRILENVAPPSDKLARRIDEIYRFHKRISRLANGNATATKRLLTTPRERDDQSANDFLERLDYRNALRALMEAASPKPQLSPVELVPRRWYEEPSIDLHDEVEPNE